MFRPSPPGSHERHQFLENTYNTLIDNLSLKPVADSIGPIALNKIIGAAELLVVPNFRGERFHLPKEYKNADAIPYVAIRNDETFYCEPEDLLPMPVQMKKIRFPLDGWRTASNTDNPRVESNLLTKMLERIPKAPEFNLDRGKINGGVHTPAVAMYGIDLHLEQAPPAFYVKGRPSLGLSFSRRFNTHTILAHELIHVDQALATPFYPICEDEMIRENQRHELEAHHYSAKYISALPARNKLVALWRLPEIIEYSTVETIRRKCADPGQPFEPNPRMLNELQQAGVKFSL